MLTVPYNHCDPPESQIPLPIEKHEYGLEVSLSVEYIERRVSIPTAVIQGSTFYVHLPIEGSPNALQAGKKVSVEIKAGKASPRAGK